MLHSKPIKWDSIFTRLRRSVYGQELPSVSKIAADRHDPFRVLISTIISARTKDEVTLAASNRLFQRANSPADLARMTEEEIATLIYPAGFYTTKAGHIKKAARKIIDDFDGKVPGNLEALLRLPGVGRKTANLVLNLGFRVDAICVDTHVHRISNRMGFVNTREPRETEKMLETVLPKQYWMEINELLVSFGKKTCTPQSPFCSRCVFNKECPQIGVEQRR